MSFTHFHLKLTDWNDGNVKPTMDGVYQRQHHGWTAYARFSNGQWYVGAYDKFDAAKAVKRAPNQRLLWRGLMKPAVTGGKPKP